MNPAGDGADPQSGAYGIRFELPAALTIAGASALHDALVRLVEATDIVVLDAAAVEKVDTAGVQLLAAFVDERRDQGLLTELRSRGERLDETVRLLALDDYFV